MCVALTVQKIQLIDSQIFWRKYFLPCNSWGCPDCAKVKAHKVAVKSRKGFENCRVRFVTLTARKGLNISQMLKSLKEAWNRLRTELTRNGKKLKYFWCLEAGEKNHRPHLHILIDRYIPQKRLSRLAARSGFGSIVDIRAVKDSSVFNYVTKYLSKGIGSKTVEMALKRQNGRRYGTSRGFAPAAEKKDSGITIRIEPPRESYETEKKKIELFNEKHKDGKSWSFKSRRIECCIGEIEPWMGEPAEIYADFADGTLKCKNFFTLQHFREIFGPDNFNDYQKTLPKTPKAQQDGLEPANETVTATSAA